MFMTLIEETDPAALEPLEKAAPVKKERSKKAPEPEKTDLQTVYIPSRKTMDYLTETLVDETTGKKTKQKYLTVTLNGKSTRVDCDKQVKVSPDVAAVAISYSKGLAA